MSRKITLSGWKHLVDSLNPDDKPLPLKEWFRKYVHKLPPKPEIKSTEEEWKDLSK
jgi:hypothetical protein